MCSLCFAFIFLLGTLEIPSVDYDKEILYPNLKMNNDVEAFYEGTEELQQNVGLRELKEKIKKALSTV